MFTIQVKGLLSLSWTVQGKYQALTQLVPIIGTPTILQVISYLDWISVQLI